MLYNNFLTKNFLIFFYQKFQEVLYKGINKKKHEYIIVYIFYV